MPSTASVTEGGAEVSLTFKLEPPARGSGTVQLVPVGQDGATSADYMITGTSFDFIPGDDIPTFRVIALNDEDDDDGESVRISFGTLPPWMTAGADAIVTLIDTDTTNTPATGKPVITGVAQVGEVLTAMRGTIDDEDGTSMADAGDPDFAYTWQWLRVDSSGTETPITGATSATYLLVPADVDMKLKVRAHFTDDRDAMEMRTSDATASSVAPSSVISFMPSTASVTEGGAEVSLTFKLEPPARGSGTVQLVPVGQDGATSADYMITGTSFDFIPGDDIPTFRVIALNDEDDDDGESVRISFGTLPPWMTAGADAIVTLIDTDTTNTPATGKPVITGVAQVGEVLTAMRGTIDDEDGTSMADAGDPDFAYTWQWLRVDSSGTETPITGATSATYLLVPADVDMKLKVRAHFTDDRDAMEMRTSDATASSVAPSSVISFMPSTASVTEGGAEVSLTFKLEPPARGSGTVQLVPVGQDGATSADYMITGTSFDFIPGDDIPTFRVIALNDEDDDDGESVRISFGTLPPWMTAGADAIVTLIDTDTTNTPATGKPVITGVAQVGEVLTAMRGTIDDEDGTSMADAGDPDFAYTWQWLRVDSSGTETPITGATSATYLLVPADVDMKLKVRAHFTDDRDAMEMRTSDATASSVAPSSVISFMPSTASVTEGGAEVSLTFKLEPPARGSGTVQLVPVGQDGATSADYMITGTSFDFIPGDDIPTFRVIALNDEDDDDGESVRISFGTLPPWMTAGADAIVTLIDTDTTNTPATGKPVITGVAQVGEVLTAMRGTIDDEDGTSMADAGDPDFAYTWQWLRVDSSGTETPITGATSATYLLVPADVDMKLKVRAHFTDDRDAMEMRTSDATASSVAPSSVISFMPSTASVTEGGAEVSLTFKLEPPARGSGTVQLVPVGQDGATSADYMITGTSFDFIPGDDIPTFRVIALNDEDDDDGESVRISFGTLPPWMTAGADAIVTLIDTDTTNTPATGKPVITGVAQVGEVLTAMRGTIDDEDGTSMADAGDPDFAYTWQWLRVDSDGVSNEMEIGTNSATYTLVAADVGKKFRVQVSFVDNQSNIEGPLASDVYPAEGATINTVPVFTDGDDTRSFDENVGDATETENAIIGAPVMATDADSDQMIYALKGTDACRFTFEPSTGQISTRMGENYDHEVTPICIVTVTARDSNGGTAVMAVTINVNDRNEPPLAPDAPTMSPTTDSTTSLDVSWDAPDNTGRPTITGYHLQYKKTLDSTWTDGPQGGVSGMSASISGLDEGTAYEVQVRATNDEGVGPWSAFGTGSTAAIPDRTAPVVSWLPRFGRTVSEQVVEAAQARMAATPAPGLAGQLAGQTIAIAPGRGSAEARADAEVGFAALGESFFGAGNATGNAWDDTGDGAAERGYSSRALTGRDFLTGSAFALTGDGGDSAATLWGRGAVTSFDGRDGSLSLDGEVVSGMLGIDWRNGERSGGLMLSRSRGEGDYRSSAAGGATSDDGRISATLTGLYPWLGHRVNDRLTLWGVAGYGRGTLTLTPAGEDALSAGIGLTMGSVGARGALGAGAEGTVLAWEADALALRTTSDAASGAAGRLDATSSGVTRLRLGLTGSRRFRLGSGAALTPGLEVGLRHDGGDAETGFGADIGVSLDFADPARGITAAVSARGLLDHAASGFRERGLSATLTWDQRPGSDLGWSLSLGHGVGAATEGGAASLLARQTLEGLAGDAGAEGGLQRRFDATLGYGVPVAAGRFVAVSGIGFGLTDTGREYSVGWRLGLARSGPMDLHLGLEATRQESATGSPTHDHGLDLGAAIRW